MGLQGNSTQPQDQGTEVEKSMLCAGMNTHLRITRLWGVVTGEAGPAVKPSYKGPGVKV